MPTHTQLWLPAVLIAALATACGGTASNDVRKAAPEAPAVSHFASSGGLSTTVVRPGSVPALQAPSSAHAKGTASTEKQATVETPPPPPAPRPELLRSCEQPRSIVVYKAARQVELRCGEAVAARYGMSLGFAPAGDKHHEGDGRTPEGEYAITAKFVSSFHRSLQLNYPNKDDAARGLAEGQITRRQHDSIVHAVDSCRQPPQTTGLGSYLQIHGAGGGPGYSDWTLGCVALENDDIEQVFAFHQPGCRRGKPVTPVRILP